MSDALNCYVISLPTAQERRKHINKEFSRQGLRYSFLDALSPADNLQPYIEKFIPNLNQAALSEGEKCCFLSHLLLWDKCLQENLPYIIIFEDDVVLSNNSDRFLKNDYWLKERFDFHQPFILRLETYLMPVNIESSNINGFNGYDFKILQSIHYGSAGYIISKEKIKQLFIDFKTTSSIDIKPFDNHIFSSKHLTCQLSPAICVQHNILYDKTHMTSYISQGRSEFRRKIKENRSLIQFLNHVLLRIGRIMQKLKNKIHNKDIIQFR